MNRVFPLIRKELQYYANSAIAYVVGVVFLVISSIWLFNMNQFVVKDDASLRYYFEAFPVLFVLILPALTMRTWAEEQRQGTLEVLMTLPYSEWKLVMGKFLAPLILLGILMLFTIPVPLSVSFLGRFDFGVIVTQYVGMFLLGGAGIAIGMYISSLTKHQVTAFLLSAIVLLVLTLLSQFASPANLPSWLADFINFLSLFYHVESFLKGLIDTRDLAYFGGLIALFLFLNERSLVLRKWR